MNMDNRKVELVELKGQLRQLAGSRAPGIEDIKRGPGIRGTHVFSLV